MSHQVISQNNIYLVWSRMFNELIYWTQDLSDAIEHDNNFTIVRGYKVT